MAKYRWVARMIEVIEHTYEFETDLPSKSAAESHLYEMGGIPLGDSEQEVISTAMKLEPAPGFEPPGEDEVIDDAPPAIPPLHG